MLASTALAFSQVGPKSITGGLTSCAQIDATGLNTVAINVAGTWTGTIQPQGALLGQAAFSLLVTPAASVTPQATITANGAFVVGVSGLSLFQVCGNTVTGTATVYLNGSSAFFSPGGSSGGGSTNAGLVISSSGITPPSPLATAACPTGEAPFMYGLNTSGNYQDLASWDTAGAPPTPIGQVTFCWPFIYNDTGTSVHTNRAFSVIHYAGNGGLINSTSNDDSAIMGILDNLGAGQNFHQLLTFYGENVLSGTPTFGGHAGGEVSTSVYRGNHTITASAITGGGGFYVYSGQFEHDGSAVMPSSTGVYHAYLTSNGGSGNMGNTQVSGYDCGGGFAGTETNWWATCYSAAPAAPLWPGISGLANVGYFSANYGTGASDYDLYMAGVNATGTAAGFNALTGPTTLGALAHAAAGMQLDIQGGGVIQTQTDTTTGNLNDVTLGTILNPGATKTGNVNMLLLNQTSSMTQAMSGRLRGININFQPQSTGLISRTEALNVGNFSSGTNNFGLSIGVLVDTETLTTGGTDAENDGIRVQTGAGGTGGTITNDYGVQVPAPSTAGTMTHHYGLWFGDQSTNTASRNPDGWAIFDSANSKWQVGRLSSVTNCAANGSAANPSVVTCGAATAGAFTCATNASTGTCTVNTTSITANSEVFIQPTAASAGLTCNATADAPTGPRFASLSAGTSFTINLGSFTTTAECFKYWIVN